MKKLVLLFVTIFISLSINAQAVTYKTYTANSLIGGVDVS